MALLMAVLNLNNNLTIFKFVWEDATCTGVKPVLDFTSTVASCFKNSATALPFRIQQQYVMHIVKKIKKKENMQLFIMDC